MLRRTCSWIVVFALLTGLWPRAAYAEGISLLRDAEIEETLHAYSDPIFVAAGLDPRGVKINLVGNKDINAFVAGGKQVFLFTGLILTAESPNQIKGVVAHETGHIAGGHITRANEGMRAAMKPMLLTLGAGLIAAAAGQGGAAAGLIGSAGHFGTLSLLKYSRNQESSADQAGMTYLERTGQSGAGMLGFFEKFRYQEEVSDQRKYPYFRSHPLSSDRISALRTRVAHSQRSAKPDSAEDIKRFEMMRAKIDGFMNPPNQTFVKYKERDTGQPARYARAIAYYQNAQTEKAVSLIDGLIAENPDNPYFYELKGQVLFEAGRAKEAVPFHAKAVALKPDNALLRTSLAQSQIAAEDDTLLPAALDGLNRALTLEPGNGFAWTQIAIANDRLGRAGPARLASAEARFAAGDYDQARVFALRARDLLPKNGPDWRRAADIVLASKPTDDDLKSLGTDKLGREAKP